MASENQSINIEALYGILCFHIGLFNTEVKRNAAVTDGTTQKNIHSCTQVGCVSHGNSYF